MPNEQGLRSHAPGPGPRLEVSGPTYCRVCGISSLHLTRALCHSTHIEASTQTPLRGDCASQPGVSESCLYSVLVLMILLYRCMYVHDPTDTLLSSETPVFNLLHPSVSLLMAPENPAASSLFRIWSGRVPSLVILHRAAWICTGPSK